MLACVYPAENFKSKAVTVKLRHGRSKRKPKLLSVKEKLADGKQPECNDTAPKLENEVSFPLFVTFLLPSPFDPRVSRPLPFLRVSLHVAKIVHPLVFIPSPFPLTFYRVRSSDDTLLDA